MQAMRDYAASVTLAFDLAIVGERGCEETDRLLKCSRIQNHSILNENFNYCFSRCM